MESFDMRFLREKVEIAENRNFESGPAEKPLTTEGTGDADPARNPRF
jgi:hypothetical protein